MNELNSRKFRYVVKRLSSNTIQLFVIISVASPAKDHPQQMDKFWSNSPKQISLYTFHKSSLADQTHQ